MPKFGDWDEDNPSSGEAFTGIFNRVSEEKQTSATKVPMIIDDSIYLNSYHHDTSSSKPSTVSVSFYFVFALIDTLSELKN